jgi:hypothetical protein
LGLLSSLRRQWILATLLLLLTLAATVFGFLKLPLTYQSHSSVVMLPPKSVAKSYGDNPYLAFSSNLNIFADVVRYETMNAATANSLVAQGYTSSYLVSDATDTGGPVLDIVVTGHNKASVTRTLYGVTSEISARVKALQVGLIKNNLVQETVITFAPQPTALRSKKEKPLLVVFGLGLVLTIGIPVIVDAQRSRRRTTGETAYPDTADRPSRRVPYPVMEREPVGRFREPGHHFSEPVDRLAGKRIHAFTLRQTRKNAGNGLDSGSPSLPPQERLPL